MKLNLECSPSLTMSIPISSCLRTTSETESLIPRASAARSCAPPVSLAYNVAAMPGCRGRLPTCVVRILSSLRFTVPSFLGLSILARSRVEARDVASSLRRPSRFCRSRALPGGLPRFYSCDLSVLGPDRNVSPHKSSKWLARQVVRLGADLLQASDERFVRYDFVESAGHLLDDIARQVGRAEHTHPRQHLEIRNHRLMKCRSVRQSRVADLRTDGQCDDSLGF